MNKNIKRILIVLVIAIVGTIFVEGFIFAYKEFPTQMVISYLK